MGGLMSLTGTEATGPLRAGLAVSDLSTGLFAAIGVLVALREREVSGRGQWVQASLLHSMIAMMDFQVARYVNDGAVPQPAGNDHPTSAPMGLFDASDGRFNIGATGEATWRRLCETIGRPDWVGRPEWASEPLRVRHRASLSEALQAVFSGGTVDRWVRALNDAGVPAGPLYTVPERVEDPQVRHLGVVAQTTTSDGAPVRVISQPVKLSRTPARVARGAPDWGEQTDEILGELGYSAGEIAALRAANAV
ncbi:MAG: CaiB/BaiF CoA-transferase family protein [Burkholderiales bacterium]|nr:CaiB/BaiF CoA-transferase family protein [Burkholderiales bacterium]